jgi:hypothetical protein
MQVGETPLGHLCDAREAPGVRCNQRAGHFWSGTYFCCRHFDKFIAAVFEINMAVAESRHADLVRMLEESTKRYSRLKTGCTLNEGGES